MYKNTTFKEKMAILSPWLPHIVDTIKKDLKQEHLSRDWGFVKQYCLGKNPNKLTPEELSQAYEQAISTSETGEELAEFLCNRWLLKNSDLYHHFEKELSKHFPNFSDLEIIDESTSKALMDEAIKHFGAPNTYQFCVINSVVFPKSVFDELSNRAHKEVESKKQEDMEKQEKKSLEEFKNDCEQTIARLTDKYEKKLLGLQKKYTTDVEALKKQIAALQRKIAV